MTAPVNDPRAVIQLAEKIVGILARKGISTAMIGAAAMAVHGYARSTADLDLGTVIDPTPALTRLAAELREQGLDASYEHPDREDALGGVVRVLSPDGAIDVVNFLNPYRKGIEMLAREALEKAQPAADGSPLKVVPLAHLIGLKLYAGGSKAAADVSELLNANPELPVENLRRFLEPHGLADALDRVLALSGHE
ncbi:MAG: hypothetical protein M3Y59_03805 [Myxococcota bacterium]|nr:hypothetical protein [Myxococcota bacterium]